MAIGGIYNAGTVTITSGGVIVVGTGTLWNANKIEIGDWLFIGGQVGLVAEVTNDTHLSLETPWIGTLPTASAYIIIKMSWLRYDPALTQAKLRQLLAEIEAQGTFVFTDVAPPDPTLGTDGQWALQTNVSPWRLWYHTGGVWVEQAPPGGAFVEPPNDGVLYGRKQASGVGSWVHAVAQGGDVTDTSSVIRDPATHWKPTYYGNPGHAIVHRLNRVFVGESTLGSSDVPMSTPDWVETAFPGITSLSQLICASTIGANAVSGAVRTSDYRAWSGGVSGGTQAVNGVAVNDDSGSGNPIAVGVFGQTLHNNGITGITETAEFNISVKTGAAIAAVTPNVGLTANSAVGVNISSGFTAYTANVSAAIHVGTSITAKFQKGIVINKTGLDPGIGVGGAGVAMELATGQSVRWLDASNAVMGEIYADANGLQLRGMAPTTYTPTVTFVGGSGTSASSIVGKYVLLGKILWVNCNATIACTTVPTAVLFTIPSGLNISGTGLQQVTGMNNSTGFSLVASAGQFGTQVQVVRYDGTSPVTANGQVISLAGTIALWPP